MYIISPKFNRRIFLDNGISDYQERLKVLTELILNNHEIIDYCQNNNRIKSNRQILAYEKVKMILENCATYLLMGQFKENNILTIHKIRVYNSKVIPVSNSDTNAEDLLYAVSADENTEYSLSASVDLTDKEHPKDVLNMSLDEIKKRNKTKIKRVKRYKQSKSYRMEKLYSTKEVKTYRLKQLFYQDSEGKKKPVKNVFGQPVFDAEYVTIGGRKGLIPLGKLYNSQWCIVDTDNKFKFMDKEYKIDGKVEQYQIGEDNQCEMDKILVYHFPDDSKTVFYDMNVERIDNSLIRQA